MDEPERFNMLLEDFCADYVGEIRGTTGLT